MNLCVFVCLCLVVDIGNGYLTQSIRYQTNLQPQNDITIRLMVHLDKALTKKLAKEYGAKSRSKLKTITSTIVGNAKALLNHPSLNQTVKLKLIGIKFLRNNKNVTMDTNASEYLKSYCDWQANIKIARRDLYYSILLTGLDLFTDRNGQKNKMATGRAYRNGSCHLRKSCALLEWEKKKFGYLLAHEIGHSLGMGHDGPPFNNCKDEINIMAMRYDPRRHPITWSACSRQYLKQFLRSNKASCLKTGTRITLQDSH